MVHSLSASSVQVSITSGGNTSTNDASQVWQPRTTVCSVGRWCAPGAS